MRLNSKLLVFEKKSNLGKFWLTMQLVVFVFTFIQTQTVFAGNNKYVVNLMTMNAEIDLNSIKNISFLKRNYNLIVYIKGSGVKKKYVLSVGYFPSYKKAKKSIPGLSKFYSGAYAVKFISSYKVVQSSARSSKTNNFQKNTLPVSEPGFSLVKENDDPVIKAEKLEKIMASAKASIKGGDYKRAIQLFSVVLSATDNEYSQEALELLGVSRERNDQYNHAVSIYNRYIEKYPKSKDVSRVKQRLAVLITASKRITKSDKKKVKTKIRPWTLYGSLSQSYNNHNGENIDLFTFLRLTSRKRNESTDLKFQYTASSTDSLKYDDQSDFQISEIFADVTFRDAHFTSRIGRLRSRTGGIFGRIDGLILSYDGSGTSRYNFIAGLPVEHSRDHLFDTEQNKKKIYGINTDISFLDKSLDINLYALSQYNNDVEDRQSVGMEMRFFKKAVSIFSLLDYEASYGEVNIFLLTGNWKLSDYSSLFFNVDYRNNPLLTTTNALIGQTETDLGSLVSLLGEEEVRQLAIDRSTTSRLTSIGLLGALSADATIRGDISVTDVSASSASGGVPALPMRGPDYYYSLQFVSKNFFILKDTGILQFHYSDTEASKKVTSLITARLPMTSKLRLSPRIILSSTDLKSGIKREEVKASLRTDYKYGRQLQMDMDIGVDFSKVKSQDSDTLRNYYCIASYHWLF